MNLNLNKLNIIVYVFKQTLDKLQHIAPLICRGLSQPMLKVIKFSPILYSALVKQ